MTCHNDETIPTLDDLLQRVLIVAQTPLATILLVREVLLLEMKSLGLLPRQSPLLHRLLRQIVLEGKCDEFSGSPSSQSYIN